MNLKVTLCQTEVVWNSRQANLDNAYNMARGIDADVIIFPEMFSTGYRKAEEAFADTMSGQTVEWFKTLARETGSAITGSVMMKDKNSAGEDIFVNRLIFATPEGQIYHYDKRHLFTLSGEHKYYTAGRERIIINYKGFRILPLICYDLRFPVWSRGYNDFDLMIYTASWDKSRIGMWDALLKARAIENQCFVAGVNFTGEDPDGSYNGHSVVLDYFGNEMAAVGEGRVGTAGAELDLDALNHYREKFRAWEDGDKFSIYI